MRAGRARVGAMEDLQVRALHGMPPLSPDGSFTPPHHHHHLIATTTTTTHRRMCWRT